MITCRYPLILIMLLTSLSACDGILQKNHHKPNAFEKSLIERKIKGTDYLISLPEDYVINESKGPDFNTYYFHLADSTNDRYFSGGFYLGNNAKEFWSQNDSCREETLSSVFLGEYKQWKTYHCHKDFKLQLVTHTKSSNSFDQFIHAFGSGPSKSELNKLLMVYMTMHRKQDKDEE